MSGRTVMCTPSTGAGYDIVQLFFIIVFGHASTSGSTDRF